MRNAAVGLAALASLSLVAGTRAAQKQRDYTNCGELTVAQNMTKIIKAKGLGCHNARDVASRYEAATIGSEDFPMPGDVDQVGGYRCKFATYFDPFEVAYSCRDARRGSRKAVKALYPPEREPVKAAGGVRVLCWNKHYPGGGPPDIRTEPKRCSLYRDGYNYEAAGAVHMRKLKWKHWGKSKAVARGEYAQPMDLDDPWKPIEVRLKQRKSDCGRTVYSRAVFYNPTFGGSDGFPIWTC